MKIVINKDIWEYRVRLRSYEKINPVLIVPTNLGWKSNGENVMGAGIAEEIKSLFPLLPKEYGSFCQSVAKNEYFNTLVQYEMRGFKLLMFPTKSLDVNKPHLSWKRNSSLKQIERSCIDMIRFDMVKPDETYLLPMVGCGNGKLEWYQVEPILNEYFKYFDNIVLFQIKEEPDYSKKSDIIKVSSSDWII